MNFYLSKVFMPPAGLHFLLSGNQQTENNPSFRSDKVAISFALLM